jgi:hypothetical protein
VFLDPAAPALNYSRITSSPITRTPIVGAKNSIVGVKNSVGTRERLSNYINSSIFNDLATIWVILSPSLTNFALIER